MKSSKDIEPRVGMQVVFTPYNRRMKLAKKNKHGTFVRSDGEIQYMLSWDIGNYEIEWIPPTDEERKMFVDTADRQIGFITSEDKCDCYDNKDNDCRRYDELGGRGNYQRRASIALSLALDGADYDNMPEGFE